MAAQESQQRTPDADLLISFIFISLIAFTLGRAYRTKRVAMSGEWPYQEAILYSFLWIDIPPGSSVAFYVESFQLYIIDLCA